VAIIRDMTEDFQYDLSSGTANSSFDSTNINYDISINNLPFLISVNNQNKYQRETAQYKKDQFDSSIEPGEQSFTGWWLRSQTSWHNGAGITFYEPGTDYQSVSHRFADSRGIDVWTIGQATILPELFEAYTGDNGINAATGKNGTNECLVSGDSKGNIKRVTLSGNTLVTGSAFYNGATYPEGHNGTNYSFTSVTTDGSNYYAACKRAIHTGNIATLSSDEVAFCFDTSAVNADATNTFIKYVKGYVLFGLGNKLHTLTIVPYGAGRTTSSHGNHTGGTDSLGTNLTTHLNPSWIWNDAAGSPGSIYASGNGGNNGEIWKIGFDTTGATVTTAMADATMALSLPEGETVNAIHYYLGYLAVGTNRGIRICPVDAQGDLILGPLLIELDTPTNGFTERGSYIYAATSALNEDGTYTHGALIRIDLSSQFTDGTFAYAYDLEYRSSVNVANESPFTASNSEFTEVYNIDDRLVCVVEENGAGELQVEHSTNKRDTGWLKTGNIRFATTEPKFFKFISLGGRVSSEDTITITTIDSENSEYDLLNVDSRSLDKDIEIARPAAAIERLALKFTFNNNSPVTSLPILESYQIKTLPAIRRQRLIQYPLSCFNNEKDRYNSQFGYEERAYELMKSLELLEEASDFVSVHDYRTGEVYTGLIEEVRFSNESSPDKNHSNFGGLLLVTIRKIS
jgi:hypothetical protein